jgi:hypothetical protein
MDTYRGLFNDSAHLDSGQSEPSLTGEDWPEVEFGEDEASREPPPSPVGQDERRMQVRAYNHWASLLDNRNFPSIEDLDPEHLPDFGPYSVLLDFTGGIENPAIQYLGQKLGLECGTDGEIESLSDVPARSLLSRITDHYMQILANQAPIGFEAEFVNQRAQTILYRGILLPFSSDDDTIDFIYGVINWKELADQQTTDELMLEIDQALEIAPATGLQRDLPAPAWADGPLTLDSQTDDEVPVPSDPIGNAWDALDLTIEAPDDDYADVLDLAGLAGAELSPGDLPAPAFAPLELSIPADDDVLELATDDEADAEADEDPTGLVTDDLGYASLADLPETAETEFAPEPGAVDTHGMELADWLASARELAEAARGSEDRTRHALYAAIGRAYDFSLAAHDAPEDFAELVTDSGLTVQDRAPMTPVVKLVFGAEYDKTRLTEFATALSHAQRIGLAQGALFDFLRSAPGGLKGVVTEERRLKREDSGHSAAPVRDTPHEALARKLRNLDHFALDSVSAQGSEFTLLVARRLPNGEVVLLGEVGDDVPLLERAARKLL